MHEEDYKKKLTHEEYRVLRGGATEVPFSGAYVHTYDSGMYKCRACGNILFSSEAKFDSGTGWPSFEDVAASDAVELVSDMSYGMHRTEVRCKKCSSHLGHVFDDGPTITGKRYCINSICLDLHKNNEDFKDVSNLPDRGV